MKEGKGMVKEVINMAVGAVSNKGQSQDLSRAMRGEQKDQASQIQKKQTKRIEKRQAAAVQKLTAASEQPKSAEELRDRNQVLKASTSKMTGRGARLDKVA
jgi:hypothetical protein